MLQRCFSISSTRSLTTRSRSFVCDAAHILSVLQRNQSWRSPSRSYGGHVASTLPARQYKEQAATIPMPVEIKVKGNNGSFIDLSDEDIYSITAEREKMPYELVSELDKYIIGQTEAKRAVAIALRNRWRRRQIPAIIREEVAPKNILMIGPTGVGKTEIARRLAKMTNSPFIKVEATKFTEVGFHGRDVDQIIRDLVDIAIQQIEAKLRVRYRKKIEPVVEDKILNALQGSRDIPRDTLKVMLKQGLLDTREIQVKHLDEGIQLYFRLDELEHIKTIKISECRQLLEEQEIEKMLTPSRIHRVAIEAVEQDGIVFIDELDKICHPTRSTPGSHQGSDVSADGVQRDLLPLIEGCQVATRCGNIDTSKILFIGSGAFQSCKPSDLLAELQGRLPIRVELKALSQQDLYRILSEPRYNPIQQQIELMQTEGVVVKFTDAAVQEIARVAAEVNRTVENIGARRLHTVIEKIMEPISFSCDEQREVTVSIEDVKKHVSEMLLRTDLSKFIL